MLEPLGDASFEEVQQVILQHDGSLNQNNESKIQRIFYSDGNR